MYEPDDDFFCEDAKRPSKAAERRGWRSAVQDELDELGDLYGVETNILRGISYVRQTYGE